MEQKFPNRAFYILIVVIAFMFVAPFVSDKMVASGRGEGEVLGTYIVQPGDNLTRLAVRYDTTVSELVRLNNIPNPDLILIGQVLVVPVREDVGGYPAPSDGLTPVPLENKDWISTCRQTDNPYQLACGYPGPEKESSPKPYPGPPTQIPTRTPVPAHIGTTPPTLGTPRIVYALPYP